MKAFLRVCVVFAAMVVTSASTPPITDDGRPAARVEVVAELPVPAQSPSIVLLTEAALPAVVGAAYDYNDIYCRGISGVFADVVARAAVYQGCMWVMRRVRPS